MTASQTDIKSRTVELATMAFEAFCGDVSSMFGTEAKCAHKGMTTETVKGLSQKFEKLAAVNFVDSNGILNGTFPIVFDQGGLFTLAGVIVMLPTEKILDSRNRGSVEEAEALIETIKHGGNLLVGSWDRIFREKLEGHGKFTHSNTHIGNPWENPKEKIGLTDTEEFTFISYEMTIGEHPPFNCGVVLPEAIFQSPPPAEEKIEEQPQEADIAEPAAGPVSETIQKMTQPSANPSLSALCAEDVMQKEVLWGSGDEGVQQAMAKMQQADVGYMVVGSNGQLDGIVSTFDLASTISVYLKPMFAKWRRPADDATLQIRVKWIMTRPVRTIKPETPVLEIMEDMCQSGLRCFPVVDKDGKVAGLITIFDVLRAILKAHSSHSFAGKAPQTSSLV
ncbi:MAG: CBS domain-containing protein [Phycisphaerae bacterium]|nr:CBS domain-containing protein [Phycisphaerae bacterium]